MTPYAVGQRVIVRDAYLIRPVTYPGEIVQVGRKLVDITWNDGHDDHVATFRMVDRQIHDYQGQVYFEMAIEQQAPA